MVDLKVLCCVLVIFAVFGHGAKILGIVPTPSYSHQVVFQPIWKELSLRGHQVTTLTTDPIKDAKLVNLTEIDLHFIYNSQNKNNFWESFIDKNIFTVMYEALSIWQYLGHIIFSHHEVQILIKNETEHFDVVMIEWTMISTLAFAKTFNAPIILMTSFDAMFDSQVLMGNPTHPVLYPHHLMPFDNNLSLSDRLLSVGFRVFYELFTKLVILPSEQLIVDKYFGPHYPPLEELQNDVSLLLTNSDPIFHKVKPLVPTIVQFGAGSHRTPPKPLPQELKTVLDNAENGFIYFSLGSNVKSIDLSEEKRNVITDTFAEIPYTVLWKFESDDFPNKPKNVIMSKWFPQQDVLKHPKIKLFITQGGLESMDEAIYDHVPMIGIPIMGDQKFNINKMVHKGFGLTLDFKTLQKDEFKKTILEVINNPKYRNKIKELAELALDQPMTGLEKAIWWTEYVIRHNGTKHLRSPLLDIPFYQYYLLDVVTVILIVLIVLISTIIFILKFLFRTLKKLTSKKIKMN